MLFTKAALERIADGTITLAFRHWRRPTVKAGGRLRTPIGELAIEAVEPVEEAEISAEDAVAAGYPSPAALFADLPRRKDGRLYRIAFRLAGPDPRVALREAADLSDGDVEDLRARLKRLDRTAPWTLETLRLIAAEPGTRAAALADALGRDKAALKADIRKLKALGLTESLDVGYRLSPRGKALLARLEGRK